MPIDATTGSTTTIEIPRNHQHGGGGSSAGGSGAGTSPASSPPPVKVETTDFKFELGWAPIKKWTLGQKPKFQWDHFILTWKKAGVNFTFVPDNPWEGHLKFKTDGKVTTFGVVDINGIATYEKLLAGGMFLSGQTGFELHVDPVAEGARPKVAPHLIQNFGVRRYNPAHDGTGEHDQEFSLLAFSAGLHGEDTLDLQAGFQTPWQWWKGGFGEVHLAYQSRRKDGKSLFDPRPEGLVDDQTVALNARGAFNVGQFGDPESAEDKTTREAKTDQSRKGTDIKVIVDGSVERNWDQGQDNDDAVYPYNPETGEWGQTGLSAAEATHFNGGVEVSFTRITSDTSGNFSQPPHLRDFLLSEDDDHHREPTFGVRFSLDVDRSTYGGLYYIEREGTDPSICDNAPGSSGLYTEAETGGFFGQASDKKTQCRLSREDVALSWSVRGDFIDFISPKFRLGSLGDLSVTPSFGMKTWVAGPNKGRTDVLLGASFALSKISGAPKRTTTR